MSIRLIKRNDSVFSKLLKEINNCPERLFTLGNVDLLNENRMMAVVGSRKMSQYGKEMVKRIVPELVKNKFVIVSGMALGVDAEVHKVCLDNGGKTIAVLASGVDVASPKSNEWIYKRIMNEGGLVISENKNGTYPNKKYFLERNRIISGLSLGIIVIEGALKSGTLVTAKFAAEQGREVMAVPGRVGDENSQTPNYLIKNGADIIYDLSCIVDNICSV